MKTIVQLLFNFIYAVFLLISAPWLIWRASQGKSRRGWGQKLLGLATNDPRLPASWQQSIKDPNQASKSAPRFWMHAVSVGEVNLLIPLAAELKSRFPNSLLAISTSTETGYDLAISTFDSLPNTIVFFCPFDFSFAVRRTLKTLSPDCLILAELELWPNLISVAQQQNVPVSVANGRLSEKSFRGYQRFRWLTASCFRGLSLVAAQNQTYAQRFIDLGCIPERVHVSGSIKFDGAATDRNHPTTQQLASKAGFTQDDFVIVAGSTQLEEDLMIAQAFQSLKPEMPSLKCVLVPRHPQRVPKLATELRQLGVSFSLRSKLRSTASGQSDATDDVIVVDVIGELGFWWGRADAGYVGGSMGDREGQNMIEPAAFGVPICFGPRTKNFRDVVDQLLADDAAEVVHDLNQLIAFFRMTFEAPQRANAMGQRARQVVLRNLGATSKTVDLIVDLLPNEVS